MYVYFIILFLSIKHLGNIVNLLWIKDLWFMNKNNKYKYAINNLLKDNHEN